VPSRSVRTVRRLPTRRRIKPMRQGDLDGLCGVYAIINAIRWLCPSMSEAQSQKLFVAIIAARQSRPVRNPLAFIHRGLTRAGLTCLVDAATSWVAINFGVEIEATWLAPNAKKRGPFAETWQQIARSVGTESVAIIGLGNWIDHWTVVVDASPRQLTLLDSDGMAALTRDRCTPQRNGKLHYRLELRAVLVVRRIGRLVPVGEQVLLF